MKPSPEKFIWLAVVFLVMVLFIPQIIYAADAPVPTVNLEVGIQGTQSVVGITGWIERIYLFATAIVGGLAVVMIIIGAVQYSTSAGNKAAMGSAKETITSAIIGLVIVLMAYLILGTFSGSFVNLANPQLETIDTGHRQEYGTTNLCVTDQTTGKGKCTEGQGFGRECPILGEECIPLPKHYECINKDNGHNSSLNQCAQVDGEAGDSCDRTNPQACKECKIENAPCYQGTSCCPGLKCCSDGPSGSNQWEYCAKTCAKCDRNWSKAECDRHAADCTYNTRFKTCRPK